MVFSISLVHKNDVFIRYFDCMAVMETKNTYLYPPSPFLYKAVFVAEFSPKIAAKDA